MAAAAAAVAVALLKLDLHAAECRSSEGGFCSRKAQEATCLAKASSWRRLARTGGGDQANPGVGWRRSGGSRGAVGTSGSVLGPVFVPRVMRSSVCAEVPADGSSAMR